MKTVEQERKDLIDSLRLLVLNYDGAIEQSPHYDQLARLLVSDCIIGKDKKK
jgi:hypothetical protein